MTDETLVRKFGLLGRTSEEDLDDEDELLAEEGYRAFVISRQANRSAMMLNLMYCSGASISFAYSHLYTVELTADRSVRMTFTEHEVQISGTGLAEMYRRLQLHRVLQISEADRPARELAKDGEPVIDAIKVRELGAAGAASE